MDRARCKFRLTEIRKSTHGHTPTFTQDQTTLVFTTQYDSSLREDVSFSKATPSGRVEMVVDNPAALAFFKAGQAYYFDVIEAAD